MGMKPIANSSLLTSTIFLFLLNHSKSHDEPIMSDGFVFLLFALSWSCLLSTYVDVWLSEIQKKKKKKSHGISRRMNLLRNKEWYVYCIESSVPLLLKMNEWIENGHCRWLKRTIALIFIHRNTHFTQNNKANAAARESWFHKFMVRVGNSNNLTFVIIQLYVPHKHNKFSLVFGWGCFRILCMMFFW